MSVAKIETVHKSRKDQGKCSKCGVELPAGSGYLCWYPQFRSNRKIVRCLKKECFPTPGERESSKAATILLAQESFHDTIGELEDLTDIETAVQEVAEAVEEVASEYSDALDAWENGNEQIQEKVDHYTEQSDNILNWSYEGPDQPDRCDEYEEESHPEDSAECEACRELHETWVEEARQAARDMVDGIETL